MRIDRKSFFSRIAARRVLVSVVCALSLSACTAGPARIAAGSTADYCPLEPNDSATHCRHDGPPTDGETKYRAIRPLSADTIRSQPGHHYQIIGARQIEGDEIDIKFEKDQKFTIFVESGGIFLRHYKKDPPMTDANLIAKSKLSIDETGLWAIGDAYPRGSATPSGYYYIYWLNERSSCDHDSPDAPRCKRLRIEYFDHDDQCSALHHPNALIPHPLRNVYPKNGMAAAASPSTALTRAGEHCVILQTGEGDADEGRDPSL